jgi:hypothetical protein
MYNVGSEFSGFLWQFPNSRQSRICVVVIDCRTTETKTASKRDCEWIVAAEASKSAERVWLLAEHRTPGTRPQEPM